jgi:hypothetical protein
MSREAFEAWVMQAHGITRDITIDGGMYWASDVEIAWRAWQACRAAALEEAAERVKPAWGQACADAIRALKEKE